MAEAELSHRLPTEDETAIASEAITKMGRALTPDGVLPIKVEEGGAEVRIDLPRPIGEAMLSLLAHIAEGEMVTLVPSGTVLTSQQAADLLNVSRPFLTRMLDAGEIDHHMVGSHRRVKVVDVLAYKEKRDRERSQALRDLQRLGQEFESA